MSRGILSVIVILVFAIFSCTEEEPEATDSQILAKVGAYKLVLNDVTPYLNAAQTQADSQQVIRTITENWLRDHVLIAEAQKNKPNTPELDKLVEDYRKSLLIFYYEKQLTNQLLDTIVTQSDIAEYFAVNKNQYTLEKDIFKIKYIKLPKPVTDEAYLRTNWNANDTASNKRLIEYARSNAKMYVLNSKGWMSVDEIRTLLPEGRVDIERLKPGFRQEWNDNDYLYLLRVEDGRKMGDIPPIEYVEGQLERFILYERKQSFIKELKEELFQKALSNKEAKIFIE